LSQDRLLILFGAMSPTDDMRKGFRELRRALEVVAQSPLASRTQAVVFGSNTPLPPDLLPIPAVSLGRLDGDEALATAYNCADLVVVPSLEDNLPNVALEAIACGAPVAAFDLCGMPDVVTDGWNGRLVPRVDPVSLGHALVDMLSDSEKLLTMRLNARQRAQRSFSLKDQAEAYLALYEQTVTRRLIQGSRRLTSGDLN
jgi:glycosyltransferase involved in cell wall biosynthesis